MKVTNVLKTGFNKLTGVFDYLQPYILTIIIFFVSVIFSIELWRNQGSTEFSKNLYSMLAIGIDMGKFFFPIAAFSVWRNSGILNKGLGFVYLGLGVGCFVYSIFASMSFNLIEIQNLKQSAYKNSQEFMQQQSYEENKSKAIVQLEKDIEKLEADKDSQISSLKKIRDEWDPAKYKDGKIWRQEEMQKAQNKLTAATEAWDEKISKTKAKLNDLRLEKAQVFENTSTKEFGNSILFPSTEAQKNFFFWMSILIEMVGIFAGIEATRRKNGLKFLTSPTPPTKNEIPNNNIDHSSKIRFMPNIEKVPTPTMEKKAEINTNVRGSKPCMMESQYKSVSLSKENLDSCNVQGNSEQKTVVEYKIDDAFLQKYIDVVLSSENYKRNKTSPGIPRLAEALNAEVEKVRSAKRILQEMGFLESRGKGSFTAVHSKGFEKKFKAVL